MNKVTIQPFDLNNKIPNRQVTASPKLINRFKKNTSYVDRFRINKKQSLEQQQIFHFDDSFCFKEGHRPATTDPKTCTLDTSNKKCQSQVMNIKVNDTISNSSRKGSFFQLSSNKKYQNGSTLMLQFEQQNYQSQTRQRNHTSYSARKKYRAIKAQNSKTLLSQRGTPNKKNNLNKSTLIPSSPKVIQKESARKNKFKPQNYWQVSVVDPLTNEKPKEKKVNFFQYSIIKAEEIKAASLIQRQDQKSDRKRKDQKTLYLEMLNQLKKKQALVKRNNKMKEQINYCHKKTGNKTLVRPRQLAIAEIGLRKCQSKNDDKDDVKPWDVEPLSSQHIFNDLI